jgi:hypothetical protein
MDSIFAEYTRALIMEIESSVDIEHIDRALPLETVYFGGGTPTILPAEYLADILTSLRRGFGISADAEITTEANPGTVDESKLVKLKQAGFNRLSLGVQSFDEVIVYPKVLALSDLGLPSSLPVGEVRTTQRFFEDPARTSPVREYRPGDPLQRMHWKVSASSGSLHVREFQPSIALDTTLFLNLSEDEFEIQALGYMSEFAIEVAASLAYYLHQQRQSVGLICNGRDGGPTVGVSEKKPIRINSHKGAGQLMQVMEALSRVQVHQGKSFVSCLSEEGRQLSWGSTILVVTSEDTPEIVDALFSLRRAGYLCMVFLVGNKVNHPGFLVAPPMPGITFFRGRHEGELEALGRPRIAV